MTQLGAGEESEAKPPPLIVGTPSVSEHYFRALGIPISRGRTFEKRDGGRTATLVAVGLIAGLLGAAAATRVLKTFLFAVEPFDPVTLLMVAAALATVAVLASVIPARHAARVDPMVALRCE